MILDCVQLILKSSCPPSVSLTPSQNTSCFSGPCFPNPAEGLSCLPASGWPSTQPHGPRVNSGDSEQQGTKKFPDPLVYACCLSAAETSSPQEAVNGWLSGCSFRMLTRESSESSTGLPAALAFYFLPQQDSDASRAKGYITDSSCDNLEEYRGMHGGPCL